MNTIGLKGAVESFEMHDPCGNTCAAALFKDSEQDFDLWLWNFNSGLPRQFKGNFKSCKSKMDDFFYLKIKEGFIQPLADTQGNPID